MPLILSRYIALRLLTSIVVTFLIIFALIFLVDFVNLIQDLAQNPNANILHIAGLGFLRSPIIAEEVFAFIVLFASIAAFISLSRKMELVVARATGVSIW